MRRSRPGGVPVSPVAALLADPTETKILDPSRLTARSRVECPPVGKCGTTISGADVALVSPRVKAYRTTRPSSPTYRYLGGPWLAEAGGQTAMPNGPSRPDANTETLG